MLHFFNFNLQTEVRVDASDPAIGCVIVQFEENSHKKLIIAINSRKLKESEVDYSIPKKELIAAIFFLQKYQDLLTRMKFMLRSTARR